MENRRKHYRIKNRFRFILFMSLLLVIAVFFVNSILGTDKVASLSTPAQVEIRVQAGDTLWNIARDYGPSDVDTRRVVYEICQINNVTAETIYPGQTLLIPEYF